MKLELKHLACYLPYGLKAYTLFQDGKNTIPLTKDVDCYNVMSFVQNDTNYKIVLHPISDISQLFNQFVDVMKFGKEYKSHLFFEEKPLTKLTDLFIIKSKLAVELSINKAQPLTAPYLAIEVLLKNHFDVFGLIDAGLAIDINQIS